MSTITTEFCRAFLEMHDSDYLRAVERVPGLRRGAWVRLNKYKDADGIVCRDFANRAMPVVITLAEGREGERRLIVRRERAMGMWEPFFVQHFEEWYDNNTVHTWEEKHLWHTLVASDFRFGEGWDEQQGYFYFIQPRNCDDDEGWDQHLSLGHIFPKDWRGGEMMECTWGFYGDGAKGDRRRDDLIALGFTHDPEIEQNL